MPAVRIPCLFDYDGKCIIQAKDVDRFAEFDTENPKHGPTVNELASAEQIHAVLSKSVFINKASIKLCINGKITTHHAPRMQSYFTVKDFRKLLAKSINQTVITTAHRIECIVFKNGCYYPCVTYRWPYGPPSVKHVFYINGLRACYTPL